MKRFLYILSLIFMMTMVSHAEVLAHHVVSHDRVDLSDCPREAAHRKDALYEVRGTQNSHEAVLDNSRDYLRTTNTRPVRLLPSFQPTLGETAVLPALGFHPLFSSYRPGLHIRASSPIRVCASARYYVFSLRRIIC